MQYKTTCENEGYSNSKKQLTIHSVNNQSESNGFFAKGGKICSIFGWNSLDSVWFGNSSFEEIPDGLVRSKLLSINVSFAGLLRVKPEDFSNGQNLKELDLSHNQLKVLENKLFSNLTGLIKLDASFNQINFIHPEAFKNCCKFLTVLELQHNKIQKIDSEIFKLLQSDLNDGHYRFIYNQYVDISYNEFTELEISKNVEYLNVANNQIKQLSLEAGSLMWSLNLSGNCLENLRENDLFDVESLVELDLCNNYLGPLNISTFSKLTKLEVLNFKGTNISNFQLGTFSHQHSLKNLNISDNFLGQLDLHWFLSLDRLEEFYLSGNKLRKIENLSQIKTIFPDLEKISITNNYFDCSYLVEIDKFMEWSSIEAVHYDAPPVRHETNVKGIRCVGNVPSKSSAENEDKFLAGNDTSINGLKEMLDYRFDRMAKMTEIKENVKAFQYHSVKEESTLNYFLDFLLGAAALMIIISTIVKLMDFFGFKRFFQRTRNFKLRH